MDFSSAPASDIHLRDVEPSDIDVFYDQQLDPEATAMAAFAARDHESHVAHWIKILKDDNCITRTIVTDGQVAGNIGSWVQDDHREIGYWIGKSLWGRGIATSALQQFLQIVEERPLYAWAARHNSGSIRVLEKCGFLFDRDEADHVVFRIA